MAVRIVRPRDFTTATSALPLNLCGICQKWLRKLARLVDCPDDEYRLTFKYHESYSTWREALRHKCYICCRVSRDIPQILVDEWTDVDSELDAGVEEGLLWFFIELSVGDQTVDFGLRGRALKNDEGFTTVVRDIGESTNSSSAWGLVERRLDRCDHDHPSCAPQAVDQSVSGWYPTRLLDLSPPLIYDKYKDNKDEKAEAEAEGNGNDTPLFVRVIETAQEKLSGRYVTLSHCWGGKSFLCLACSNKDEFTTAGIALQRLPKTFQEAVQAARRLGIRYLWIDSLCIVQNDDADWAREAPLMHLAHRRAWCNISATASRNGSEGLFRSRQGQVVSELVVDVGGSMKIRFLEDDIFSGDVSRSPLQSRAWVLQERLLSPRVLHFGESQILWECNELTACEMFPEGMPEEIVCDEELRKLFAIDDHSKDGNGSKPGDSFEAWASIVRDFTRRSITFDRDRLPALSGIAQHFYPLMGGPYLAGAWNNADILFHLNWACLGPSRRGPAGRQPSSDYGTPTWSWASMDCYIMYASYPIKPRLKAKLLDAHVTLARDERGGVFGAVAGGFLRLEGTLERPPKELPEGFFGRPRSYFLDSSLNDDKLESLSEFYLLELYEVYEDLEERRSVHRFLILERDPDMPTSCRRCGVAYGRGSSYKRDKKLLVDAGPDAPCEKYLGPGKGHVVRIV